MAVRVIEDINNDKTKKMLQKDLERGLLNDRLIYLLCIVPDGTVVEIEYEDGFKWKYIKTDTNTNEQISHWKMQSNEDGYMHTENVDYHAIVDQINPSVECKITVR